MANVTKVLITGVQYAKDTDGRVTWVDVSAYPVGETTPEHPLAGVSAEDAVAYVGSSPVGNPINVEFKASNFAIDGETGLYTLFGENANQIPTTVKSPLIRYQIKTVVDTDPVTETTNTGYYYMMLIAGFAANAFTGAGGTATVTGTSFPCNIAFYFPGFENTDTDRDTVNALLSLLQDPRNWIITVTSAATGPVRYAPSSAIVRDSAEQADYGLRQFRMSLDATLNFPQSDTYAVTVNFFTNTISPALSIPGSQSIVALVTEYLGSTQTVLVFGSVTANFTVNVAAAPV
jgi:hypothetical protein